VTKNNETKITIAGFGGQGVVLAGTILAKTAMADDKAVTGMISYGAEMRGGTANASLVISDEAITSPVVERPNAAIILNQPSLDKFEKLIMPGGVVIINSSLAKYDQQRDDLEIATIDATEIAIKLGDVRVANIVAIGAFICKTKLLKPELATAAIEDTFAGKKQKLIEINIKALQAGIENCIS
jgi:2-oxoglutarate ferredoxin oxidoreductase subunit gamma